MGAPIGNTNASGPHKKGSSIRLRSWSKKKVAARMRHAGVPVKKKKKTSTIHLRSLSKKQVAKMMRH